MANYNGQAAKRQRIEENSRNMRGGYNYNNRGGQGDNDDGNKAPNRILLLTVLDPVYPITVDVINTIATPIGKVQKIVIFKKNGVQALVEYDNIESATKAKQALDGADIYSGCCTLKIEFAKLKTLHVKKNDSENWDYTVSASGRSEPRPPLIEQLPSCLPSSSYKDGGRASPSGYRSDNMDRGRERMDRNYPPERLGRGSNLPERMERGIPSERLERSFPSERMERGGYPSERLERGGYPAERMGRGDYLSERMERGGLLPERLERAGLLPERLDRGGLLPEILERGGFPSERMQRGGLLPERMERGGFPSERMVVGRRDSFPLDRMDRERGLSFPLESLDRYDEFRRGRDRYPSPDGFGGSLLDRLLERSPLGGRFQGPGRRSPVGPRYMDDMESEGPIEEDGAVVMVYELNLEKVNCDKIFNLLCLYGKVVKVKFLKHKEGCAMVQMTERDAVENIIENLNGITFFESTIQMGYSKQAFLADVLRPYELPDGTASFQDYHNHRNNRNEKKRVLPPSKTLHFYNAPSSIKEEKLQKIFEDKGVTPPTSVRLFTSKTTTKTSSGLLEFDKLSDALEGLLVCNHFVISTQSESPFTLKLCFSAGSRN